MGYRYICITIRVCRWVLYVARTNDRFKDNSGAKNRVENDRGWFLRAHPLEIRLMESLMLLYTSWNWHGGKRVLLGFCVHKTVTSQDYVNKLSVTSYYNINIGRYSPIILSGVSTQCAFLCAVNAQIEYWDILYRHFRNINSSLCVYYFPTSFLFHYLDHS